MNWLRSRVLRLAGHCCNNSSDVGLGSLEKQGPGTRCRRANTCNSILPGSSCGRIDHWIWNQMGVDGTLRFDLESHFPGDIHDVTSSGPP